MILHRNIVNRKDNFFKESCLLIFILLIFSGNPFIYKEGWAKLSLVMITLLLAFRYRELIFINFFFRKYIVYSAGFIVLLLLQAVFLGFISLPFVLGFLLKILLAYIIFSKVGSKFSLNFFYVLFWVSIVSFPFYLVHFVNPTIDIGPIISSKSVFFYTFRMPTAIESNVRNSSLFWEPGAYQAYLNICFFLNFVNIKFLYKHERFKLLFLVLCLLTTFSTTGYVLFFLLLLAYLIKYSKVHKGTIFLLSFVLLSLGAYLFFTLDFLNEKIVAQNERAFERNSNDEFDPNRLGALLFDMHYIEKSPFIGNGFHESTRFRDHPELISLIEETGSIGHGNGLSDFIASAGFLGFLFYLYSISKIRTNKFNTVILCILVCCLLFGEPLLNYSFFLGIPFLKFQNFIIKGKNL